MYSQSVPALISKNVGNTLSNYATWGSIVINVKSYGAKGDGIADDTAAILEAIDQIPTNARGVVFFPTGSYKITQTITITNKGVTFMGWDKITSVLYFYGCDGIVHSGDFNFTIRNLGLYTNSTAYTGIKLTTRLTANSLELDEVDLFGFPFGQKNWAIGLYLEDVQNTWASRLSYTGNYTDAPLYAGIGVKVSSTKAKSSTGHHFLNCSINYADTCFDFEALNNPSIEGLRIDKTGMVGVRRGVYYTGAASGYVPPLLTITDSHIDLRAGGTGIELNTVSQIEITGCDLYAYNDNCTVIKADAVNSLKIHDNYIVCGTNANLTAVAIASSSLRVEIYNNQLLGNWATGISISTNSTMCYERSNEFFGTVTNAIVDSSNALFSRTGNRVFCTFSTNIGIADSTNVKVSWTAASPNWGGMWSNTNATRITIPTGVKKVMISGQVRFNIENTTGRRQINVLKNGVFARGFPLITVPAVNSAETDIYFCSGTIPVVAGDYLELQVLQVSSASVSISAGVCFFQVEVVDFYNS